MGTASYNVNTGSWETGGVGSQAWKDSSGVSTAPERHLGYVVCVGICVYCIWRLRALEKKDSDNNSPTQDALRATLVGTVFLWLLVGLFHNFGWFQTLMTFRS